SQGDDNMSVLGRLGSSHPMQGTRTGEDIMQTMATAMKRDSHPTTNASIQLKDIKKTLPLRVLSEADWQHWTTPGYVIVRQAVPQENVERLAHLLWEFDEKDPDDPSTWYAPQRREHKMKELNNTGMLEIYNH